MFLKNLANSCRPGFLIPFVWRPFKGSHCLIVTENRTNYFSSMMSLPLLPAEITQYSALIDALFERSDLQTVTARQIRKALSAQLGKDISNQKEALQDLIIERFDVAAKSINMSSHDSSVFSPKTNSHHRDNGPSLEENIQKRKLNDNAHHSNIHTENNLSAKAKRIKTSNTSSILENEDEKYARMLQDEENKGTCATRGKLKNKKVEKGPINEQLSTKRNLKKARSSTNDDCDDGLDYVGTRAQAKEGEKKNGGFHKQYYLSEPLAELLGESRLSRPQVVKNIWAYIKARDLQDPNDRRQIICDERMQLVFKQNRVHMFTMNKIIGKQLYDMEDD